MLEDIKALIECIKELSEHTEVDMVWLDQMENKYKKSDSAESGVEIRLYSHLSDKVTYKNLSKIELVEVVAALEKNEDLEWS